MVMDLILRWLHILSAAVLVGGTIFQWQALAPSRGELSQELAAAVRRRWSKLVMLSSGLLLLGGLVNFVLMVQRFEIADSFPGNLYHPLFGIKFLLALVVFVLSSLLAGRTALAERLRQQERMWLTVNMILAILVVLIAGTLRQADRAPKPIEASSLTPVASHGGSTS